MAERRVVITGMSVNTPLGDTLDGFLSAMLEGRSAVTRWQRIADADIYSKLGADLSSDDAAGRVAAWEHRLPEPRFRALRRLAARAPWSTRLSLLLGLDACADAGLLDAAEAQPGAGERLGMLVAGHNINFNHQYENRLQFADEPDYMDAMLALNGLDTDHAGCVSELLGIMGPIYTVGAACASANMALRCAVDEIRYHDIDAVLVAGRGPRLLADRIARHGHDGGHYVSEFQ